MSKHIVIEEKSISFEGAWTLAELLKVADRIVEIALAEAGPARLIWPEATKVPMGKTEA